MHQALYLIVSRLEPDTMYLSVSIQRHPPLYLASKKINYKTRGKGPTDGGHTGTEKRKEHTEEHSDGHTRTSGI